MSACATLSPPPPPQFRRDLRAAPTLPGLANPSLEGIHLAIWSSVHRVKRTVCPKQPVHTSFSDLSHNTANVKPYYPPLNGVPHPTFTNGHKAWSPESTVVCRLTVPPPLPPSLLVGCRRLSPGLRPGQSEKVTAQFFQICSDHRQKKTRSGENELKIPPKLSTACSHAAELNKVL